MRQLMNQTRVFLFTSDYQEGWGAVLNEAMNGACAVVASEMAGSTPYLLQDGVNGFTCEELRAESYATRIAQLLDKERTRDRLATEAYRTVAEVWNARIAAQRLLELSTAILDGDESPELFKDGPCSKAE
jgi:glycosyltransferase involved in cell wall biosynthesis